MILGRLATQNTMHLTLYPSRKLKSVSGQHTQIVLSTPWQSPILTHDHCSALAILKTAPFRRRTSPKPLVQPQAPIGIVACKGQASTSNAKTETKRGGDIATIAQSKIV